MVSLTRDQKDIIIAVIVGLLIMFVGIPILLLCFKWWIVVNDFLKL